MHAPLQCPSAQPNMLGAVVHGVVDAASGHILPLETPVPLTPDLLAATAPLLPTQVLRIAAPCQGSTCAHFTGDACSLVTRLVQILPQTGTTLDRCVIRPTCRWFFQQGLEACRRCSSIVTDAFTRTPTLATLANPQPTDPTS